MVERMLCFNRFEGYENTLRCHWDNFRSNEIYTSENRKSWAYRVQKWIDVACSKKIRNVKLDFASRRTSKFLNSMPIVTDIYN